MISLWKSLDLREERPPTRFTKHSADKLKINNSCFNGKALDCVYADAEFSNITINKPITSHEYNAVIRNYFKH